MAYQSVIIKLNEENREHILEITEHFGEWIELLDENVSEMKKHLKFFQLLCVPAYGCKIPEDKIEEFTEAGILPMEEST